MNSDSAIFCFGEENMNSYKENKKRKDGAKIHFCAFFALCAKMGQDYLCKLRLASSIKCKVLRCAATKTTLINNKIAVSESLSSHHHACSNPTKPLAFPGSPSP
jgi:hypothetical protein